MTEETKGPDDPTEAEPSVTYGDDGGRLTVSIGESLKMSKQPTMSSATLTDTETGNEVTIDIPISWTEAGWTSHTKPDSFDDDGSPEFYHVTVKLVDTFTLRALDGLLFRTGHKTLDYRLCTCLRSDAMHLLVVRRLRGLGEDENGEGPIEVSEGKVGDLYVTIEVFAQLGGCPEHQRVVDTMDVPWPIWDEVHKLENSAVEPELEKALSDYKAIDRWCKDVGVKLEYHPLKTRVNMTELKKIWEGKLGDLGENPEALQAIEDIKNLADAKNSTGIGDALMANEAFAELQIPVAFYINENEEVTLGA